MAALAAQLDDLEISERALIKVLRELETCGCLRSDEPASLSALGLELALNDLVHGFHAGYARDVPRLLLIECADIALHPQEPFDAVRVLNAFKHEHARRSVHLDRIRGDRPLQPFYAMDIKVRSSLKSSTDQQLTCL